MHRWKILAVALFAAAAALVAILLAPPSTGSAQPAGNGQARSQVLMFGGSPARNMVNLIDKNTPIDWSIEEGKKKNIKWIAKLGSHCYGGPIVADGKVFVGTDNSGLRDKKLVDKKGDPLKAAILMAFRESDGEYLWQIAHTDPNDPAYYMYGLCSTPVFEDGRLYYVSPNAEIVCANSAGKVLWAYNMAKELGVVPHHVANCSPLIDGDLLMLCTSNGADEEGKVVAPAAPSFIAVNKKDGTLKWKSSLPGKKIISGQWSNPTLASVNGKKQVIFAGGDCVIYGLEPASGEMIWKCNCNPKPRPAGEVNPYIISTPVVVKDRLYVGLGVHPDGQTLPFSYFVSLDITKKGDVSPKSLDTKDPANKGSALVWAFGGEINPPPKRGLRVYFGSTISTAAVHDGLIYICEERGILHCLDANTGARYWEHDFRESIWGSAYWVDGKVYVCTQSGDAYAFAQGKERKYYCEGKLHSAKENKDVRPVTSMEDQIESTPVVAGGVLYVASKSKLFAIANEK